MKFWIVFLTLALSISAGMVMAQAAWVVPAASKNTKNPVKATPESIQKGKALYNTHCKSCHGDPGKGNGLPLVPKPTDPASDAYQKNTDGEKFYKITTGRGAMPAFKDVLKEEERWHIVNFARSLSKKKVAEASAESEESATSIAVVSEPLPEGSLSLSIRFDDETHTVYAQALKKTESGAQPVAGIPVGFFVKRYFRPLPFGEENLLTDADGMVMAEFPADLPADTAGQVEIIARVIDEDGRWGVVEASALKLWGKPLQAYNMRDARSLWNENWKAPLWLLIAYFGAVAGLLATLAYIMLLLKGLKKAGEQPA